MRRALVVTDDTAHHPFLASLPPHIRQGSAAVSTLRAQARSTAWVQEFLLAYIAGVVVVGLFIF